MKYSKVSRIVRILTVLQAEKPVNVDELAKMSGVGRRTIFRDLKELEAIGVPYHYDPKTGGYFIEPGFFLPPINLNLQEALSLLMLVHKTGAQMELPFRNAAVMAVLKIENQLPLKVRRRCNTALENISTRLSARAPMNQLDHVFAQLQKAVGRKLKVKMRYNSLFDKKIIDLQLCPYHLMYGHRAWYVIGKSLLHNEVRTFKLNRIIELKILDKGFLGGDKFDVYEYLGRAWAMIPQGQLYNVKLKFLPKVATNVSEVQWHSTQKVTHNPDGSVTIEFRVDGLDEISWWVLGYGDQVQVLAPKKLRQRIRQAAENMIEINAPE